MSAATGDGPVLRATTDASRSVGRSLVGYWWKKAQKLAALEPTRGRGWLVHGDLAIRPPATFDRLLRVAPLALAGGRESEPSLMSASRDHRSNPPPPRSGLLGRGGRGTGMTMLGLRSRSRVCSRSLIVSRTAHALRSVSTSLLR